MNWSSLVIAVLFGIQPEYVSAQSLQVQVNGEITSDTQFCINQTLTFVCTVQISTFQWTVGSLLTGSDGLVAVGGGGALNTLTRGMFTLTAEGASAPNFRSTLTVEASAELSGTMITCANNLNSNDNQFSELSIHGPPFITVNADTQGSLDSLMLTLNIPNSVTLRACLHNITASLYRIDGSTVTNEERSLMVDNFDITLTFTGLSFCDFTYNYVVMGNGIIKSNSVSDDVTVPPARGSISLVNVTVEESKVTIIVHATFEDCPNSIAGVNRSDGQFRYIIVGANHMLEFTDSESALETCTAIVILNSGLMFNIGSFECDKNKPYASPTMFMSSIATTPPPLPTPPGNNPLPSGAIIGIAVGGVVLMVTVLLILIVGLVIRFKLKKSKELKSSNNKDGRRAHDMNVEYDEIQPQNKSRKDKFASENREVFMEECIAYGRVSTKTDQHFAIAASNSDAQIPGVYEAIY